MDVGADVVCCPFQRGFLGFDVFALYADGDECAEVMDFLCLAGDGALELSDAVLSLPSGVYLSS